MVHYSTDYVFDGQGSHYRLEDEATGPLNVYGETKRAGEIALEQANPRHLIFRTSWVYATRGANFAKTMLRLAGEKEALSIINDQHGAPTGAELLAPLLGASGRCRCCGHGAAASAGQKTDPGPIDRGQDAGIV